MRSRFRSSWPALAAMLVVLCVAVIGLVLFPDAKLFKAMLAIDALALALLYLVVGLPGADG